MDQPSPALYRRLFKLLLALALLGTLLFERLSASGEVDPPTPPPTKVTAPVSL